MSNPKTESELLFQLYLDSYGINYEHEKYLKENEKSCVKGEKTPDYSVYLDNQELLFELKQIERKEYFSGQLIASSIEDDLKPIRHLINNAREQFKRFKNNGIPCSLVIQSYDLISYWILKTPMCMFGAMYGNPGLTIPFATSLKSVDVPSPYESFLDGGKMFRYKKIEDKEIKEPIDIQNRTISALITLREIEGQIGVIVYENIYAKNQLPRNIFCGDYDIRFGKDKNQIKTVFVGNKIIDDKSYNEEVDFVINLV